MQLQKLGICFSGGGGKGAYQIGVWKALRDFGYESDIAAISGTSVGGLNGAMVAQQRYEEAERLWLNVESYNILTVQDVPQLASMITASAMLAQASPLLAGLPMLIQTKGLFKKEGLQAMLDIGVDANRLINSAIPLTVTHHAFRQNHICYYPVTQHEHVHSALLATSALPYIFDPIEINENPYTDGGFYWGLPHKKIDNTPVKPLVEAGCDTIIVVCLSQDDLSFAPNQFPGVRILPIVPSKGLGGIMSTMDFSNEGASRRMEQGYADACLIFRHLQMFLDNEVEYEALWQRVAASAQDEKQTRITLGGNDQQHVKTMVDIADFDRIVVTDHFDGALHATIESDEVPVALAQLSLQNSSLLADIERSDIETQVNNFLVNNQNNREKVECAVMDALAALSPVAGRADHLREQGLFSRLWHSLTGKNQKLAAESDHALAQAQFAALRLIAAVQEKGVLTLEFTCALQNRIQGAYKEIERLGARHNTDMRHVYRSMAHVYSKLREKLMEHDERLQRLERRTSLLEWISHPNMPRLHGKMYREMPQMLRLACIVNDFFLSTQGNWHVSELFTLQEMLDKMGLLANNTLQADQFFDALQHDGETQQALLKSLAQSRAENTGLLSLPAAKWLDDLRHHRLVEAKASVVAALAWGYAPEQPINTWSLALDLLYHMRAAGLTPLKNSELGQTKQHWLETLDVLDELVTESVLPSAFSQEITLVRKRIQGFKLTVPLIGKFSTGKSTLLNAWFGEDIQPKDLGPCTALATEFHYAEAGQEKLVVVRVPNSETGVMVREELPAQSYHQTLIKLQKNAQDVLHLELHRDLAVLASHPDIILVDTPGLESSKGEHERALAQYVEQSVVFVLCVNRSHLGESESRFVDRLHSLGQDFAVLICQEDLINRSQRDSVRHTIGEQAKIDSALQLVRGCSAQEGDLAGFRDILANFEQQKSSLFQQRFAGSIVSLVQRAESLIRQQLAADTNAQSLRVRQEEISQK